MLSLLLTRAWLEGYSSLSVCVCGVCMCVCVCVSALFQMFKRIFNFTFEKYANGRLTCKPSLCVLLHLLNIFIVEKDKKKDSF